MDRSNAFDVCICIAVLHHLATDERRLAALKELVRVVRTGGQILLYVWALEQDLEKIKMKRLKEKEFCEETGEETLISLSHKSKSIEEDIKRSELDSSNCENIESHPFEQKKDEEETAVSKESHESFSSFNSAVDHAGDSWKFRVNENRNMFEQQDVFVPWKYRGNNNSKLMKKESKGRSEGEQTLSPPQDKDRVYHRYYHVFKEGELIGLCERLDNVGVRRHYYEKGNWCVLLEKLND